MTVIKAKDQLMALRVSDPLTRPFSLLLPTLENVLPCAFPRSMLATEFLCLPPEKCPFLEPYTRNIVSSLVRRNLSEMQGMEEAYKAENVRNSFANDRNFDIDQS